MTPNKLLSSAEFAEAIGFDPTEHSSGNHGIPSVLKKKFGIDPIAQVGEGNSVRHYYSKEQVPEARRRIDEEKERRKSAPTKKEATTPKFDGMHQLQCAVEEIRRNQDVLAEMLGSFLARVDALTEALDRKNEGEQLARQKLFAKLDELGKQIDKLERAWR